MGNNNDDKNGDDHCDDDDGGDDDDDEEAEEDDKPYVCGIQNNALKMESVQGKENLENCLREQKRKHGRNRN